MRPPTVLNGNRVLSFAALPDGSCRVLVELPYNQLTPYVVARWYPACGDSWDHGHYMASYDRAVAILHRR